MPPARPEPRTSTINLLDSIEETRAENTNQFMIEFTFLDKILGTQPRNADVMRAWLESKHLPAEIIEDQVSRMDPGEKIDDATERAWTTFFSDDHGPWIGTYQVEALFRELLTSRGITVEKRGSKQTYQHLLEVWACDENGTVYEGGEGARLHFWRDGAPVPVPDGHVEKTAHVQTAQGERSVIKRHDYVENAKVRFLLVVPANMAHGRASAVIDEKTIALLLAHAGGDGLGCSRSQGFGQFKVTRFDQLTQNRWSKPAPKKGANDVAE